MVNYGNSKIYKIERKTDNVLVYVGSTTKEYLSQRMVEHKSKAKICPNRKIYKSITDNGGWLNHQILLIKQYSCNSRDALRSEEARFIRALKPINNIEIPMRTMKEYYLDNKDKINKYTKEYYLENKEKIQQYYIENKEKIQQYRIENKEKMQQYYIDNKEIIKLKSKTYTINNKEKIQQYYIENKEKLNQKINCCCGSTYKYQHKSHHFKSEKHINSITIQFKLIEEMQNNRKKYIFQPIPTL